MKKLIMTLFVLVTSHSVLAFDCATDTIPSICTREYQPSTCNYGWAKASGSNKCVARINLLKKLCASSPNRVISDRRIRCKAQRRPGVIRPIQKIINVCKERSGVCTREYRPHTCDLNGILPTDGPNKCSAKRRLYGELCDNGVVSVKESSVNCQSNR
jgi:hypothetical protein